MRARAAAGGYPPLATPFGRKHVEISRREFLAGLSVMPFANSVLTQSARAAARSSSSTDIVFAPGLRATRTEILKAAARQIGAL